MGVEEVEIPVALPGRCKRTDGRSWRCKLRRLDGGGGFCEAHYQQRLGVARARVSVSTGGGDGKRKRGRPRKREGKGFVAKGNEGDEQGELLKAGKIDSMGKDMDSVHGSRERAKEDDSGAGRDWKKVYERRKGAKEGDSLCGKDNLESESSSLARASSGLEKGKIHEEISEGITAPSPPLPASGSMPWELPMHQCSIRSATGIEIWKDVSTSKWGQTVGDEFDCKDETFVAKGDREDEKEKITKSGKILESKDVEKVYGRRKRAKEEGMKVVDLEVGHSSVTRVLDGFEQGPSHLEKPKENSIFGECRQVSFPRYDALQNLYEGNPGEGRINFTSTHSNNQDVGGDENEGKDAVVAPSSSPSSPNIGESTHRLSLPTQTFKQPPAPSASTSYMVRTEGGQNEIAEVMLENLDIGSGKKIQRAKKESKSASKFSISRCAAALNEMTGFTPEELVKASKVFVKSFNREMFLSLKDELRRAWLRDQISD